MPRQTFQVPKFKTKDDPELWLYRYDKASKMNGWDNDTMLKFVDSSFNYSLQLWFMQQDFKNWDKFKVTFLSKFSKKVNLGKIVMELLNFKMKKNESSEDYVTRFETKRNIYNREVYRRSQKDNINPKEDVKTNVSETTNTETVKPRIIVDAEFVITDKGFVKHFIKGITSKGLQRYIKSEKPGSLELAYLLLKEMTESDEENSTSDSDTSDSSAESDSSSESDSDSEFYTKISAKKKSRRKEKKEKSSDKPTSVIDSAQKDDPAVAQLITL